MQPRRSLALWSVAVIVALASFRLAASSASATPFTYIVTMSGVQVVPPVQSGLTGFAQLVYESDDNSLRFTIALIGAAPQNVAACELRQGSAATNGTLVAQLAGGGWTQTSGKISLTAEQAAALVAGQMYVEVRGPSGPVIRGQIFAPAVPGIVPTLTLPTVTVAVESTSPPASQAQAQAQQSGASASATGSIRPPATGDGGLR